ncbi:MAG TPA: hypothetical protein VK821_21585 [Dehalococcoidia bacterium]|nr:hypothetical protein [Dehalococcoidia bacterium]
MRCGEIGQCLWYLIEAVASPDGDAEPSGGDLSRQPVEQLGGGGGIDAGRGQVPACELLWPDAERGDEASTGNEQVRERDGVPGKVQDGVQAPPAQHADLRGHVTGVVHRVAGAQVSNEGGLLPWPGGGDDARAAGGGELDGEAWERFVALFLDGCRAEGAQPLPSPPSSAQVYRAMRRPVRPASP